jgi:hypothetical protein
MAERCESCGSDRVFEHWGCMGEDSDLFGAAMCEPCWRETPDKDVAARIRANRSSKPGGEVESRRQSPAPVDADGVPIRVGDRLSLLGPKGIQVTAIGFTEADTRVKYLCDNGNVGDSVPTIFHHPHVYTPPPEVKPCPYGKHQMANFKDRCANCGMTGAEIAGEVKPSEREREDMVDCDYCCCSHPRSDACGRAFHPIGLACALIEAVRRDFAILYALRPYMSPGDIAQANGDPPPVKGRSPGTRFLRWWTDSWPRDRHGTAPTTRPGHSESTGVCLLRANGTDFIGQAGCRASS